MKVKTGIQGISHPMLPVQITLPFRKVQCTTNNRTPYKSGGGMRRDTEVFIQNSTAEVIFSKSVYWPLGLPAI